MFTIDRNKKFSLSLSLMEGNVAYTKPIRCCVYCHEVIIGGKLKRHVFRQHKTEEGVKVALCKSKQHQVTHVMTAFCAMAFEISFTSCGR